MLTVTLTDGQRRQFPSYRGCQNCAAPTDGVGQCPNCGAGFHPQASDMQGEWLHRRKWVEAGAWVNYDGDLVVEQAGLWIAVIPAGQWQRWSIGEPA